MFRIGEFSKIARVSGRLLRYYDEIGLLHPIFIDPESGYRYYSADQLPRLNRILALKELGLTLDQIARLMDEDVSVDEIRGMLTMKKVEIEQAISEERQRIRGIELRLKQIEQHGTLPPHDIVVKPLPELQVLSVRDTMADFSEALDVFAEIVTALPAQAGDLAIGNLIATLHSEAFETQDIDAEIGLSLNEPYSGSVTLSGGRQMAVHTMPAVETAVTYIASGPADYAYTAYNALGTWMEANDYSFAGSTREVFLEMPDFDDPDTFTREIQVPAQKAAPNLALTP